MLSKMTLMVGAALAVGAAGASVAVLQRAPLHRVDRSRPANVTVTKVIRGTKTVAIVPSTPAIAMKTPVPTAPLPSVAVPFARSIAAVPVTETPPVQVAAVCTPSSAIRNASYVPTREEALIIADHLARAAGRLPEGSKTQDYEAAFAMVAVSSECGCSTVKAALPGLSKSNLPQFANLNKRARGALFGLASTLGNCGTGAISEGRPFAIAELPAFSVGGGSDYRR
ncbi:hypothetical protein C8J40_1021 [Sphingomonas sp. PP-CC-3A-396]|nr:hypothetical protein C8J40_1021 [Sphingomonas sp. PP-CC-3A-396]